MQGFIELSSRRMQEGATITSDDKNALLLAIAKGGIASKFVATDASVETH